MKKIPDALFVVDIAKEDIAVKEATKLNIPIIALVDTDGDPTPVAHVLPGNDDAIRSIQLATSLIVDNYIYGCQLRLEKLAEMAKQKEIEKAEKQKISSEKEEKNKDETSKKPTPKKEPASKKPAPKKEPESKNPTPEKES